MIDRAVQVGDRYGMRLNVGKTKVMRIGRGEKGPLTVQVEGRVLEEVL